MWDDTLTEFYPGANYFAKSIHAGRFPLWFPGVRDGIPFYSDPQMAVFYLPQWLLIPFAHDGWLSFVVYQRYIVLHYFMGSVFMYAFLRQLKLSPLCCHGRRARFQSFRLSFPEDRQLRNDSGVRLASAAIVVRSSADQRRRTLGVARVRRRGVDVALGGTPADDSLLLVPGHRVLVISQL